MAERESLAVHPAHASALVFGPFRFDLAERTLWRDGEEVALPPRALALLARLLDQPGKLVPKEALVAAVWPGSFVGDAALAEAVSLVREALGDDAQRPSYVQTVHRRGYRFVAPVAVEHPAGLTAAATPAPAAAEGGPLRGDAARRLLGGLAALAFLAVVALGGYFAGRRATVQPVLRHASLRLPPDLRLDVPVGPALALAPAGDLLVYSARRGDEQQLWVRRLDRAAAVPVPGTSGAAVPFLSPDGGWIGFFAGGRMAKVPAGGGEPVTLARSLYPFGASWGEDGAILYAPERDSGLWRVAASGGEPVVVTRPDAAAGELGHRWPQVLPGGRSALFTAWRGSVATSRIELLDLENGARRRLIDGASFGRYAAGFLVCVRGDGLAAAPFDLGARRLGGAPAAVLDGVAIQPGRGSAQLALAADGTLVYLPAEEDGWALLRVAPDGAVATLPLPRRRYHNVAVSPDGLRLAVTAGEGEGSALWAADLARGAMVRLAAGMAIEPVWSANGRWIAFASESGRVLRLFRVAADGSSAPAPLLPARPGDADRYPVAATSDGRSLVYVEADRTGGSDLWVLPLAGDQPAGPPSPLLRSPAAERSATVSPDGRWLAWSSNESGRSEVYLRAFAGGGGVQVSSDGGGQPRWSADGWRLWYRRGDRLLTVEVGTDAAPSVVASRVVYQDPDLDRFAVLPAGGAVVIGRDPRTAEPPRLELVLGWPAELARLVRAPRGDALSTGRRR